MFSNSEPWEVEISDEEWDDGASSDEETIAVKQNLPPPTYEDFEAALAGNGSSVKSKSKTKQEGSVSFNLRDIPKKPAGRPSLIEKPTARPAMQDAAQPPPPPPPLALGTRPRPRDGFVEPTNVGKPPPRVVRNVEPAPKKEAPPPPPLMAAPLKPQAAAAPVAVPHPPPVEQPAAVPPPPSQVVKAATEEPKLAPSKPEPVAPVVAEKKQKEVQEDQPRSSKAETREEVPAAAAAAVAPAPAVTVPEPVTAPAPPTQRPQLSGKPPRTSTAATIQSSSRQPTQYEACMAPERAVRRARSVQVALDLQSSQGQITVKVWQGNAAGVLVSDEAKEITGFIPLTELSHARASAVLKEERRIRASIADNNNANSDSTSSPDAAAAAAADAWTGEGPTLRRAAMGILRDQELLVEVIAVDKESGRVIFSEKAATQSMAQRSVVSPEGLVAAAEAVGSLVQCRVRSVRPFGIFVDFPLKLESEKEEIIIGLVHSSEVSWDNALPASVSGKKAAKPPVSFSSEESGTGQMADYAVGQAVTARLTHVDPKKARIFLSIRRATPNPLLETLDSLLASTGAGGTMPGTGTAAPGGPRQTIDAAVDMRPLLGDLEVAVKFAEDIVEVEGVVSANLGVRLESRASSPDVEVYMAKEKGEEASLGDSDGGTIYKLVLRQGRDVQEVEIKCVLDRAAVRELAAATVAKMGAQPQN
ncbi:hypothetical protein Ndes2437B_g05962 [Nannochloris sp. 'desiccata']